jgi:hypothetical protein
METFSRGTSSTPLEAWYVTGFVEGEGAFTYSRSGKQLALYFGLKLTRDDSAILEDIRDYFGGVGRIYDVAPRAARTANSGFTKPARYYRVTRLNELPRIINHFDAHPLRGLKAASYALWREMVLLKKSSFRKPPMERLNELAAHLSAASVRNRPFL